MCHILSALSVEPVAALLLSVTASAAVEAQSAIGEARQHQLAELAALGLVWGLHDD